MNTQNSNYCTVNYLETAAHLKLSLVCIQMKNEIKSLKFSVTFWGCLCFVSRWRRKFSSATSWFTNLGKVWSTWAHQEQSQTTRILCRQWSLGDRWNLFWITLSSCTCSYLISEMLFSSCLIASRIKLLQVAVLLDCTTWTGVGPGMMDAVIKGALQAGKPVGGFKISKEAGEWTSSNFHPYLDNHVYYTCRQSFLHLT